MSNYDQFISLKKLSKMKEIELINLFIELTSHQELMNTARKIEEQILIEPIKKIEKSIN